MKMLWGRTIPGGQVYDNPRASAFSRGLYRLAGFRWLPVKGAVAGIVLSVIYLFLATPLYTARMVLGPAETGGGLSGAASGLKAQLNMLMGDTGGSAVAPYELFNEMITSGMTAKALYDQGTLQLLNPSGWDAESHQWLQPSGAVATLRGTFHVMFGRPYWTAPSEQTVEDVLKNDVNSHFDNGSLYFRVYEYKNRDPKKALRFLQMLYQQADTQTRAAALARADSLAQYLQTRMGSVAEPEYRTALYQALAQQEITRIMGRSHAPFGAQVIDPPSVSQAPTDPPLFRTLVIGAVLGAAVGALLAYLGAYAATRSKPGKGP